MKPALLIDAPADNALPTSRVGDDLRGLAQLLVRGITTTTDLAESVHASILGLPSQLTGKPRSTRTRGIPRIAYQGVRTTAKLVGGGIDDVLARLPSHWGQTALSHRREAMLAVLNGVMGDHLAATGNRVVDRVSRQRPSAATRQSSLAVVVDCSIIAATDTGPWLVHE